MMAASLKRGWASGTGLNYVGTIGVRVGSFVAIGLVFRALGNELYPVFALASILIVSQGLFDFGTASAVTREAGIARRDDERRPISTALLLGLGIYGALSAVVAGLTWLFAPEIAELTGPDAASGKPALEIVRWVPAIFGMTNIVLVMSSALQGAALFGRVAISRIAGQAVLIAGLVYTVNADLAPSRVMWCFFGAALFEAAVSGIFLARFIRSLSHVGKRLGRRQFLRFGVTANALTAIDFASLIAPRIVAALAGMPGVVVGLDLGAKVGAGSQALTTPQLQPIFSAAAASDPDDRDDMGEALRLSLWTTGILMTLAIVGLFAVWPWVAEFWLGSPAPIGRPIIVLVVLGYGISAIAGPPYAALFGLSELRPLIASKLGGLFTITAALAAGAALSSATLMYAAAFLGSLVVFVVILSGSGPLPDGEWRSSARRAVVALGSIGATMMVAAFL